MFYLNEHVIPCIVDCFFPALKRYGDKISKTLAIEGKQSELHELIV